MKLVILPLFLSNHLISARPYGFWNLGGYIGKYNGYTLDARPNDANNGGANSDNIFPSNTMMSNENNVPILNDNRIFGNWDQGVNQAPIQPMNNGWGLGKTVPMVQPIKNVYKPVPQKPIQPVNNMFGGWNTYKPVPQKPIYQVQNPILFNPYNPAYKTPIVNSPAPYKPILQTYKPVYKPAPMPQKPIYQMPNRYAYKPVVQAPIVYKPVAQAPIYQVPGNKYLPIISKPVPQAPVYQVPENDLPMFQLPKIESVEFLPIGEESVVGAPAQVFMEAVEEAKEEVVQEFSQEVVEESVEVSVEEAVEVAVEIAVEETAEETAEEIVAETVAEVAVEVETVVGAAVETVMESEAETMAESEFVTTTSVKLEPMPEMTDASMNEVFEKIEEIVEDIVEEVSEPTEETLSETTVEPITSEIVPVPEDDDSGDLSIEDIYFNVQESIEEIEENSLGVSSEIAEETTMETATATAPLVFDLDALLEDSEALNDLVAAIDMELTDY